MKSEQPPVPYDPKIWGFDDSRGIPYGYDPERFFEDRHKITEANAAGLERLLYKLIPYKYLRSWSVAIDPFWDFKVSPVRISPANRTRKRFHDPSALKRNSLRVRWSQRCYSPPNTPTLGVWGPIQCDAPVVINTPSSETAMGDVECYVKDSTRRTRPPDVDQGEFELFDFTVRSPRRMTRSDNYTLTTLQYAGGLDYNRVVSYDMTTTSSPAARLSATQLATLKADELAYANALIVDETLGVMANALPSRRLYSLARNVVELKDLPRAIQETERSLLSLRNIIRGFRKDPKQWAQFLHGIGTAVLDSVPKEYVKYFFAYRQTYNDVVSLVSKPAAIANKINYLMLRSGKPTTFRAKRRFASSGTNPPNFAYNSHTGEGSIVTSSTLHREAELRVVVNTTMDFPPLETPETRQQKYDELLGAELSPTDLYNLIPWTWLVDWFTGVGQYVDIIDSINQNPSLINWGFVTASSVATLSTTRTSKVRSTRTIWHRPAAQVQVETDNVFTHTSQLVMRTQIRKDLATTFGVDTYFDASQLSAYQNSILGSIFLMKTKPRAAPQ